MNRSIQLLSLLFSFLVLLACSGSSDESVDATDPDPVDQAGEAGLRLILVDAPGDYLEVNVEIVDIRYNDQEGDEGWVSLGEPEDYPINVDLTELVAGNDLLLADELIPAGNLEQIRLVLGEANTLVIEDENGEPETFPLNTPSAQQSGLKLKIETELEAGFTYVFILDWDVNESVVEAGNSGNYNLKPVINVIAQVNSGSIQGIVQDPEGGVQDVVVQVLDINNEYVTSAITNETGIFLAQALAEGQYTLLIEDENYEPYQSPEPISVNAGDVTDVGVIELVPIE